jgi:hypothetical protein
VVIIQAISQCDAAYLYKNKYYVLSPIVWSVGEIFVKNSLSVRLYGLFV